MTDGAVTYGFLPCMGIAETAESIHWQDATPGMWGTANVSVIVGMCTHSQEVIVWPDLKCYE